MELIFYKCKICGKVIVVLSDTGVPTVCCNEKMERIVAGTTDASVEKHMPQYTVSGDTITVRVGSLPHPMTSEHHIEWIMIETKCGGQKKMLKPGSEPKATFILTDEDEFIAAYAYCNIHGLWKK